MSKGKVKKKKAPGGSTIALNKKARHEFHIEDRYEAGVSLQGWEVKAMRGGKAQITDAYILLKDGEAFLLGAQVTPLPTVSTHLIPDPTRTRKLLLHASELSKLIGATQQKGYTCVPLALYWKRNKVKCEIALVKGKKQYDKRQTEKERDWNRQKQRILREVNAG
ncbi:SsrA-binding protein [Tamilnaduibacter salinus]|uniref:SsrA-binding protein n=1 Tax=Tamilnaduibacter salinus TaxID=1484056 RepID=A0A2A2I6A6_9GAMM|nr:SsrA-binding protein SmpB [Tamilnaduibacter salinus]PAV26836.1 SsrA-binding protein [Tamilnaduibacter salinus]PVY75965.1 SsrA-binding protein [Tamilnaduibacter salinus]